MGFLEGTLLSEESYFGSELLESGPGWSALQSAKHAGKRDKPAETFPVEGIGCIPVTRGHKESFGDCAGCIEYILVTRWHGERKRSKKRVCRCDERVGN